MFNSTMSTEQLHNAVYRLLDEFPKFGHLYGTDGRLKEKYRHLVYVSSGNGKEDLCTSVTNEKVRTNPFAEYDLNCDYQDEGCAKMADLSSDDFCNTYRYLNLHNGNSNEFKFLSRNDVLGLSYQEIREAYLSEEIMNQLIAMLRHGKNYATVDPVPVTYGDSFIAEQIVSVWKSILIGTLDARDLASEQTFLALKYSDLFKDIAREKKVAVYKDTSSSFFASINVNVPLPYAGALADKRLEKVREYNLARDKAIADVIALGKDPGDDRILDKIREVTGND